jgi:cyclic pyranopterin phosphate synthase
MPEEEYEFTPASRLMQTDEIEAISKIFVSLGVKKIRLTGGEPLVRKDAGAIIKKLSGLAETLTLTTNATRIHEFIPVLKEANIRSLNVSLDTLQKDRFLLMTKRDLFDQVKSNIQSLIENQIQVKVNMVVMKGVNDSEISDFIEWTKEDPIHVRFIEFMPFTGNRWDKERVFTWNEILERASQSFDFIPLEREKHGTAKAYRVSNAKGTFAVISTMSAPFCGDCNRIRLTADGKIKNCLFSNSETDLLTPFRAGLDIVPLIQQNILAKKEALGGQFTTDLKKIETGKIENRSMITIGG